MGSISKTISLFFGVTSMFFSVIHFFLWIYSQNMSFANWTDPFKCHLTTGLILVGLAVPTIALARAQSEESILKWVFTVLIIMFLLATLLVL